MRRQYLQWLPSIALAGLLCACGGSLSAGISSFHNGDHARALEALSDVEPNQLAASDYTRYVLYRGLTHLALGDLEQAQRYLSACKLLIDEDPTRLAQEERLRLRQAWLSMGLMPRQAAPR